MKLELDKMYEAYRPLLISIAYRMLGSLSDAEDTVQDVFVSMQKADVEDIRNEKAYLVKMTTNRCLNLLSSSRKKREVYPGPWLPEPEIGEDHAGPEEQAVYKETVSYAMLVVLQQLTPVERAVFLLREVLGYDYQEIAGMVDKSEANCRKIFSRVLPKIQQEAPQQAAGKVQDKEGLVQSFLIASRTGDFGPFVSLLTDNAVMVSDGGGKRKAAMFPITGKERIRAFWEGIYKKDLLHGDLQRTLINGEPGLILYYEDELQGAICFGDGPESSPGIQTVYFIRNPDKLPR